MKTIYDPKNIDSDKDGTSHTEIQEGVEPWQHEINITDGSEFLDDAIRTKDQPYMEMSQPEDEIEY